MVEVTVSRRVRRGIKAVIWLVAALFIVPISGLVFTGFLPVDFIPFGILIGLIFFAIIYHIVENEFV